MRKNLIKYLGVILDKRFTFTCLFKLHPIFNRRTYIHTITKLATYKTVIKLPTLYARPIWSDKNNSNILIYNDCKINVII